MTDHPEASRTGSRLRSTLGNLLLALLNATLLLFIVAAIAGIVLIGRVRTLATDVASDMSRAAVASTGLDPAAAMAELRDLRTEVTGLRQLLAARGDDPREAACAALSARLDHADTLLADLRERRLTMTDRMVDRVSEAAGRFVNDIRDCRPAPSSAP